LNPILSSAHTDGRLAPASGSGGISNLNYNGEFPNQLKKRNMPIFRISQMLIHTSDTGLAFLPFNRKKMQHRNKMEEPMKQLKLPLC